MELLQVRHREVHLTKKIFTAKLSPTLDGCASEAWRSHRVRGSDPCLAWASGGGSLHLFYHIPPLFKAIRWQNNGRNKQVMQLGPMCVAPKCPHEAWTSSSR